MSRRGENIYKRKDGRWEGRYIKSHEYGKTQYGYVYSKTYRELKEKLSAVTDTMQQSLSQENASAVITFKAAATAWLDSQKSQLKQSSIVKYTNLLSTYLYPYFGAIHVTGITRENIILYSNELLYSGGVNKKGLSPKTVSSILSVLKNVLIYTEQTWNYTVVSIKVATVKLHKRFAVRLLVRRR